MIVRYIKGSIYVGFYYDDTIEEVLEEISKEQFDSFLDEIKFYCEATGIDKKDLVLKDCINIILNLRHKEII